MKTIGIYLEKWKNITLCKLIRINQRDVLKEGFYVEEEMKEGFQSD